MRYLLFLFYFIFGLAGEYALAQNYGSWEIADSLIFPRFNHASVVLPNGNILVTGGEDSVSMKQCEIYDYQTQRWRLTTPMISGRAFHNLVLLKNGKVMAVGGYKNRSCEIFDPVDETWELADSLLTSRTFGQAVAMLNNGNVLIAGGYDLDTVLWQTKILKECEIYDYRENRWYSADSLNRARSDHKITLLNDGKIFVTGGAVGINSCEIYDPDSDTWSIAASLNQGRYDHAAILLKSGKVLISGGLNYDNPTEPWVQSCEVYDPLKDDWTVVGSMATACDDHYMVYIDSVNLLIFGGFISSNLWEIYDAANFNPIYLGYYPVKKNSPTCNLLPDGKVLSIGGLSWTDDSTPAVYPCRMCEIYDPHLTSIRNENNTPENNFSLFQNYPNPFNSETKIRYFLPKKCYVKLEIFDVLGKKVRTLVHSFQYSGQHEIAFNSKNLSSGIYYYILTSGKIKKSKKMLFID